MAGHPPGAQPSQRRRLQWELLVCGVRGHELVGTDAAELRPQDAILAREDSSGTRWYRCRRCDGWLTLPRPEHPTRTHLPERSEIVLPLRGKPLRDMIVLRLIAIDRAFHFVVLAAFGLLVLVFAADRGTLRATFYKVMADLQGGVASEQSHTTHGLWHELSNAFTTSSSHLHLLGTVLLAYGAVEGIEAVGLWYQRRWAEYLTFLVTTSLLPLEIYEIVNHATPFKVLAFLVNVAVVIYLLLAKRLFGLRGGAAAGEAAGERDRGWEALECTAPPTSSLN
ncbi:MAG TPA: DUF2127 domain-containing protein [Solirubrobacteraceae bacterium]|jgi:uncharacterized membrane protein (DUF2068 family)|nr:DUF2127 domain-containing protein [Solirubrobacteraceae bacterium]